MQAYPNYLGSLARFPQGVMRCRSGQRSIAGTPDLCIASRSRTLSTLSSAATVWRRSSSRIFRRPARPMGGHPASGPFPVGDQTTPMLSLGPGEQGGNQLTAAADTELAECRSQVFLDGVGRDVQLPDDLPRGVSPDDESDHTGLRAGETEGA
jgi:hypothetical protein